MGTIHKPKTMFLRRDVGTATGDKNGHVYELGVDFGSLSPIVRDTKTGKWFTLDWKDILMLADAAGISKEDDNGNP